VVAGEDSETTGIDRERGIEPVLHAEVRDAWARRHLISLQNGNVPNPTGDRKRRREKAAGVAKHNAGLAARAAGAAVAT
jgi:hypothetical protein